MIKNALFCLILLCSTSSVSQAKNNLFTWPGGNKLAISLSYDDALNSQLNNVVPQLDKYNLKASFYVLPNPPAMNIRMEEWRAAAKNGHELGNHSMYHPCRASLPNREWIQGHHNLDNYSVSQMIEELTTANTFLKAIDGKTERTYTVPCGDLLVGGKEYLNKVSNLFMAIKGHGADKRFSLIWDPTNSTGKELIDYK
ncbi:MAG: polysaccharide deacetylase family protein [Colwellia sp.]